VKETEMEWGQTHKMLLGKIEMLTMEKSEREEAAL
jgi:hypothetical protein